RAKEIVYRALISQNWKDRRISPQEAATAEWVAKAIELHPATKKTIELEFAQDLFALKFAEYLSDRSLDQEESEHLAHIAQSVGMSLQAFARTYFAKESESFVRGMFSSFTSKNELSDSEWNR